jgi:hypothetical protein
MLERFIKQYEDLVWYAQHDKTDLNHPDRERIETIRRDDPFAYFALEGSAAAWNHGFHCGCLTEARRIVDLLSTLPSVHHEEALSVARWSDPLGAWIGPEEVGVKVPTESPIGYPQESWDTLPDEAKAWISRECSYKQIRWNTKPYGLREVMFAMTREEVKATLSDSCDHYCDLVSYARKDKADPNHSARTFIERIEEEHSDQVANLQSEDGDWHHGFNSGCLATVRLAINLLGSPEDAELAIAFFPDLDT